LFTEAILSNGCRIDANFAVVAKERVYTHYKFIEKLRESVTTIVPIQTELNLLGIEFLP
jgi:hypothetical protein